jgi:SAM-dependent methyltransferase
MMKINPKQLLRRVVRKIAGPSLMKRSLNSQLLPRMHEIAASLQPSARVLDVGAKQAPYRLVFERFRYETVDVRPEVQPTFLADIQRLTEAVPESSFDVVICTEVLEHVPDPRIAVEQIRRVLKPGGWLLATTPFMVPYHPDPRDYWRMTSEAWGVLLESWTHASVATHGNQWLALWYLASMGLGAPIRLLNRIVFPLFRGGRAKRVFLGFVVEAQK